MAHDSQKRFRPKENPSFQDGEEVCQDLGWQLARVHRVVNRYREILEPLTTDNDAGQATPPLPADEGDPSSADS